MANKEHEALMRLVEKYQQTGPKTPSEPDEADELEAQAEETATMSRTADTHGQRRRT